MSMRDNAFWKDKLNAEEYYVCREKGTEPPFSGEYYNNHETGSYVCRCCGAPLFSSTNKYDSGSGWPSFDRSVSDTAIDYESDRSLGMVRTEIMCKNCGSHLGHVFEDGPRETTGQRYCVNSLSLKFEAEQS